MGAAGRLVVDGLGLRVDAAGRPVDLVADVSFAVDPAQVVAVVGPNGAGKTTLIRMIAGLAQPSAGVVRLDGRRLSAMRFADRARRIAYVGQSEDPDGRLTVSDYVRLGRLPHETGFAQTGGVDHVARALDVVDLASFAARRMDHLSGGERQKAKIARALCQDPVLLALDEPTNHLDPRARGDLLAAVAGMGVTVIVALHDLTLVDAFANTVAVLDAGRLVAFGPPRDALSRAQVRRVFDVDLFRFDHPHANRTVAALDLAIADAGARAPTETPNPPSRS